MTDQEWMARLQAGDGQALAALMDRHWAAALHLAQGLLRDDALAEDAVQEAFARVYLLRQRYRSEFSFQAWLSAMVRNLCLDQLRRRRRAPVTVDALPDVPVESAEAAFLARESRWQVWNRLRALDENDRALLTGYALDGLSYQELARRTGLSLPQVKIRLHRIRKRLRSKEDDA